MNAIPKHVMVAAGVILCAVLVLWVVYQKGYDSAVAEYSVEAAKAAEVARKKQALDQAKINDLADKYYSAKQKEAERSNEIDDLKKSLRAANDEYAAYRLFNEAANNPDLSEAVGSRRPDEERDGIDAVQYSVREYNRVAIKVNTLTDIIKSSECYHKIR